MLIEFNDLQILTRNVLTDFEIKEILEEIDTYETPIPMCIYFIDTSDNMVAYWNPVTNSGAIRGVRQGSQWSKKHRQFTKLSVRNLI